MEQPPANLFSSDDRMIQTWGEELEEDHLMSLEQKIARKLLTTSAAQAPPHGDADEVGWDTSYYYNDDVGVNDIAPWETGVGTTGLENIIAHHDQGDLMTALQMPNIEEQFSTDNYDMIYYSEDRNSRSLP